MTLEREVLRTDRDSFAALYKRHHRALYRYCRSIVGEHDAHDAVQSTMTRAFAALRYDDREFDRRPWLFRIAHNESISIVRRRRAMVALDPELARADAVDERIEADERLRFLRQDLADLAERQRSALLLRELCGLGIAEIADELGISPGAVKQAIFEARRELSKCGDGRSTPCGEVQRMLSDADGRVMRGRRVRAHLRSCAACRRFQADVALRPTDLAALAAPSSGLAALLAGQAGGSGGALAGAMLTKIAIGAAVIVAAGSIPSASAPRGSGRSPVRRVETVVAPAPIALPRTPAIHAPVHGRVTKPVTTRHAPAVPARRERTAVRRTVARSPARRRTVTAHVVPAHATPVGQAKQNAISPAQARTNAMPPGQARKTETGNPAPPGQAKHAITPGQPKKDAIPAGQVKKNALPPGQAGDHVPPGQADPAPPGGRANGRSNAGGAPGANAGGASSGKAARDPAKPS